MSTRETKSKARERIIETAEKLFYAEGVRAVGVEDEDLVGLSRWATLGLGLVALAMTRPSSVVAVTRSCRPYEATTWWLVRARPQALTMNPPA